MGGIHAHIKTFSLVVFSVDIVARCLLWTWDSELVGVSLSRRMVTGRESGMPGRWRRERRGFRNAAEAVGYCLWILGSRLVFIGSGWRVMGNLPMAYFQRIWHDSSLRFYQPGLLLPSPSPSSTNNRHRPLRSPFPTTAHSNGPFRLPLHPRLHLRSPIQRTAALWFWFMAVHNSRRLVHPSRPRTVHLPIQKTSFARRHVDYPDYRQIRGFGQANDGELHATVVCR